MARLPTIENSREQQRQMLQDLFLNTLRNERVLVFKYAADEENGKCSRDSPYAEYQCFHGRPRIVGFHF